MSIEIKKKVLKLERQQANNKQLPIVVIYLNDWRTPPVKKGTANIDGKWLTKEEIEKYYAGKNEVLFVKYADNWKSITRIRGDYHVQNTDNEQYRG